MPLEVWTIPARRPRPRFWNGGEGGLCSGQQRERGYFLFEVLVVLSLLAILAIGFAQSTQFSIFVRAKRMRQAVALELVSDRLEEFAAQNPLTFDGSDSAVETLSKGNMSFDRTTVVTVNGDNSRTVDVTVSSNAGVFPFTLQMTNTYPLWEQS